MPEANYNLGLISKLKAESKGKPGNRTFRLLVNSPLGAALIWIEKEQLLELSLHLKRTVGLIEVGENTVEPPPETLDLEEVVTEFKVSRQAIEFDEDAQLFRFWNHESEDTYEVATLVFEATVAQVEQFANQSLEVCSAGRPMCQLCHQPKDPDGHFCSRSNGHPVNATERLQ